MRLLVAPLLAALAAPASGQVISYPPVDTTGLMPRTEAEASTASITARQAQFLTDVTLAQTAIVAISAGPRQMTVTVNCLPGDRMFMTPSDATPVPAGYMLGDIRCTTAGTATATLYAPLLSIGASYSLTVRVTAFR